jgi:hypothetical protein
MILQLQESIREIANRQRRLLELTNRLEGSLYWFMSAATLATVGILCLQELNMRQEHPSGLEHRAVAGLYKQSDRSSDGLTARVFSMLSKPER